MSYHQPPEGYPPMGSPAWPAPPPAPPWSYPPPTPPPGDADRRFVKGVLLGAAATYLLTNQTVQHTLFRAMARVWTGLRFGMEEVKERYQDAQAEVESERRE